MSAPVWKRIPCKINELRLDRTLACGQSFRWKEGEPGVWTGVIGENVWRLKQTDTHLFYMVYRSTHVSTGCGRAIKQENVKLKSTGQNAKPTCPKAVVKSEDDIKPFQTNKPVVKTDPDARTDITSKSKGSEEETLRDYFQLDVNLEKLYKQWSKADKHFAEISQQFTGIRMIRQEPVECLFSFICSSNNNISRITSMVERLAVHYGRKIMTLDGEEYFTFPRVAALSVDGVEETLRSLSFGYRAKYIQTSARYIQEHGGDKWLYSLRGEEYHSTKSQLMKLCGVGAKVADCVALFCLDKPGSIPVDTHVWQIAARDYLPKLKQAKSLTDTLYKEIGDHFRSLWGPYAGWAHSVLFTADLKKFKDNKVDSPTSSSKRKQKKNSTTEQKKSRRKLD